MFCSMQVALLRSASQVNHCSSLKDSSNSLEGECPVTLRSMDFHGDCLEIQAYSISFVARSPATSCGTCAGTVTVSQIAIVTNEIGMTTTVAIESKVGQ